METQTKKPVLTVKQSVTTNDVRRSIAVSAEGYPLLGQCIYWSFSEFKMLTTEFRQLLQDSGINPKVAHDTPEKTAVIAALEHLMDGQKLKDRHKVVEDPHQTVWVVVDLIVDSVNQDVHTRTETKVRFDKKTKSHKIESSPEIKEKLEELIAEYKLSQTTTQIRSTMLKYLFEECQGVTVRDGGGLYFVPSTHQKEFEAMQTAFQKLRDTGYCSVDVIPVIDTKEAASAMWKALTAEVVTEIADIKKDIENLKDDPSERQQQLRFNRIDKLNTKISMYATLFNKTSLDLQNGLKEVHALFLAHLAK